MLLKKDYKTGHLEGEMVAKGVHLIHKPGPRGIAKTSNLELEITSVQRTAFGDRGDVR